MMDRKGFTLIELMIVVVIIGILASIAIPNFIGMNMRAKEARVKSCCHTVQLATEDFAVQSDGVYPSDTDTDTTPLGDTVVDLLPNAAFLENPFTKALNVPLSSGVAVNPGEVGYVPFVDAAGTNVGHTITGFGRTVQVLSVSNGI